MLDASKVLDDELRGTDAVTRALLRENARLRRLVVELAVDNLTCRRQTVEVPAALAYDPATVAFNSADVTVDLSESTDLHANVLGALKMCIKAHGPISFAFIESAAKRVVGAVKVYNHNVRQKASQ